MNQASILDGRRTYITQQASPPANAGLPTAIIPAPAVGFEWVALISTESGMLPFLAAAIHEATPSGLFLLLLDQRQSAQVDPLNGTEPRAALNGDPALITLGPIFQGYDANGDPIGASLVFSESETEPWVEVNPQRPDWRHLAGFPFDGGCVAALSTTPGRLTFPTGELLAGGMRVTARWQKCG